jgi:hypothetical protein
MKKSIYIRQRPYHVENTGSRPITEVKQHRALLVLRWVTAWERSVPLAFFIDFFCGSISHREVKSLKPFQNGFSNYINYKPVSKPVPKRFLLHFP